jgi:hypothetical protein
MARVSNAVYLFLDIGLWFLWVFGFDDEGFVFVVWFVCAPLIDEDFSFLVRLCCVEFDVVEVYDIFHIFGH